MILCSRPQFRLWLPLCNEAQHIFILQLFDIVWPLLKWCFSVGDDSELLSINKTNGPPESKPNRYLPSSSSVLLWLQTRHALPLLPMKTTLWHKLTAQIQQANQTNLQHKGSLLSRCQLRAAEEKDEKGSRKIIPKVSGMQLPVWWNKVLILH